MMISQNWGPPGPHWFPTFSFMEMTNFGWFWGPLWRNNWIIARRSCRKYHFDRVKAMVFPCLKSLSMAMFVPTPMKTATYLTCHVPFKWQQHNNFLGLRSDPALRHHPQQVDVDEFLGCLPKTSTEFQHRIFPSLNGSICRTTPSYIILGESCIPLPSGYVKIAIENGHL